MTALHRRPAGRVRGRRLTAGLSALLLGVGVVATAAVPMAASAAPLAGASSSAHPPLQTCTPALTRAAQRFWAFGNSAGIDFGASGTTATAVKIPGSTVEGSTVVTDTTGQMLFWSNGATLFNRDNAVMLNGSGLNINSSATQTVAAFPSITEPGIYFVVTTTGAGEVGGKGSLYYSKVDMSLAGGLGGVTSTKNVPLGGPQDATEALTAVPNADGTGFWVITHRASTPNILAYEFDGDGPVTGTAVESVMSTANGNNFGTYNLSADLSQIVQATGSQAGVNQLRVLTIDASTGVLTEKFTWDYPSGAGTGTNAYAADFSPNGDYVYATKIFGGARLFRFKIAGATSAADVSASAENVAAIGNGGQVRRAPDGKMYVVNRTAGSLGVVNTPDAANPDYVAGGFALAAGTTNGWGLPQTVTGCPKPNDPPVVTVTGPADGAVYEYGTSVPAAYTCQDPDLASCSAVDEHGNPVNPGDPVDTTTPGTHTITVTATDDKGNTTTKTVTYTVKPKPNVPPTATVSGPAEGATYFPGQPVPAGFSCADADGTVASCNGTVPNGSNVDTSTPGTKTFTVTATDDKGAVVTKTVTYKVVAINGVCKGQALGLPLGITLGTANGRETPCVTDNDAELNLYVPITGSGPANALASTVKATALYSHTVSGVGSAAADSTIASAGVVIPSLLLNLQVTAVKTEAKSVLSSCTSPATLTSSSTIGSVKLNGLPIVIGTQPLTVPLIVGGLYINQNAVSGNTVTRRAVFLDLPGNLLDVVIAESKAGATCGS